MIWSAWREAVADPQALDELLTRPAEKWDAVIRDMQDAEEFEAEQKRRQLADLAEVG